MCMKLSQQNKRQRLLRNLTRLLLFTTPEREVDLLEMMEQAVLMDLLEVVRQAVEMLMEAKNSVCCINSADVYNLERFHEAGTGEELAEAVNFELCHPPYNLRCQTELKTTSHDLFELSDVDDFCDLDKKWIEPGRNSHVFCSTIHLSSSWRIF